MVSRAAPVPERPAAGGPAAAKPAGKARTWWLVHQWCGLKLSVFMSFILFTGTLAVLSHEIDWLLSPSLRVSPASVKSEPDWPAIVRTAQRHAGIEAVQSVSAPVASAFAATATVERADGGYHYLDIHPATGALQGERGWVGAQRILRNMHRHLNLPVKYGVPLVGALAFLLLVTLVSSLVVYKKWWRGFAKPIRTRNARTGWGDFHRLAGVWSLWFVALMALTGIWYFAESVAVPAPGFESAGADPIKPFDDGTAALAAGLARVRAERPSFRVDRIQLPDAEDGSFVIDGTHDDAAWFVRPRANAVVIDADTGELLLSLDSRTASVHQRISEAADPLHFGTVGGYWTKLPWFLFGLLLTGLSVSGAALYGMRLAGRRGERTRARPVFRRAWSGMGWWRWPAAALVATGFAMLPNLWWGG